MRFKNIRRWVVTPKLDGLLFLAQRMDELLWDYTLDTHKPMALNAPFLCREALSLIDDIEAELIEPANLKPVLEELVWSVQNDDIAKSLLDLPIDQYVLSQDGAKLHDQRLRLEALGRTLEPSRYLHRCFDQISEQVMGIEKKALDHSIRTAITTLVNMGMSKQSLFHKNTTFFFAADGPEISEPELVRDFLKSIYPYTHSFDVYFVVSKLIETVQESLGTFKIEILNELPESLSSLAATSGFAKGPDEAYVKVCELAHYDVYSAQIEAANRLDSLSDLFTLFYHQRKIVWRPQALVEQCCLDTPVAITLTKGAMDKPFDLPPEKASKELNRLLQNSATSGPSLDRFNRVADLHGICVSTDVVENQLVTLWTALETLIPSKSGQSKISNVLDAMTPFLVSSYIRRLVQRFTHDLVLWRRWDAKRILNAVPEVDGPGSIHRALALLCVSTNAGLRSRLYTELKDFQLLRFRAFQLHEILSTPEKIKSALVRHEQKVRWQIRRIYRTRNLIVHSGRRPTYIASLVENGHDYLDQIMFDVMKLSCGEYRTFTLEQAFELSRIRHQRFLATLANVQAFNAENCMFLVDDFDTLAAYLSAPWGHEPETSASMLAIPTGRMMGTASNDGLGG
jgi:hypothetical protein